MSENARATKPLKDALDASDEEGCVVALARALKSGATVESVERTILRAMAEDGEELHSMIYVSAAFDLAAGLGPEAGKYQLAAAALQIARQPKDSRVYERVEEARRMAAEGRSSHSMGEVERHLSEALDLRDVPRAVEAAIALHRLGREASFVVNLFAKWAARPEVIEKPAGYVTHLPLQIDAALNLLRHLRDEEEVDLLLGHLAFCQIELARRYQSRRVAADPSPALSTADALSALGTAIHERRLGPLHGLIAAASTGGGSVEDTGRVVMRCALESAEGLGHRFTLADAARRIARKLHPAVGRAMLHTAALSVAHGYNGPRRLLELRDLPHATPGGRDYSGRLLVGIASGNLAEAHAALRGSFESGTPPRSIALSFLDAASHLDTHKLHTDHGFILTQAAWRAIADGSFAGEAVPLLADLAVKLCKAPKDHELIQRVEDAWQDAPQAVH
jgi:hypothetical protein